MADRSGQQLESYRLLKRLGGGAFGDVYVAEDHRKRQVAVKILHGEFNAQQLQLFLREIRIVRLRHEHIISVLDFGVEPTNSTPYIVMDYASQGTLLSRHPRGSRLPLSTIIPYVRQIAAALHEAHEEGIIHRDVKPENILLDQSGTIKLADFGIAVISQSARTSLEGPQGKAGTPWYMAPEQIQGKPSRASDQYALATIVYEWLTGEPPFLGGIWEVYGQHLHATPDPLPNDIEHLTSELEAVLMKALSKSSKDRYPTIQDFASALQAAYEKASQKQTGPNKSVTELYHEGNAHHNAGRYDEAIAVWNQVLQRDPSYATAYNNRGLAYYAQQKYSEAIADYNQAIRLNPSYANAYNNRGLAYQAQQKYEEAIADYGQAIKLNPSYAFAYNNRGNAYYAQQKYAEAIADYGRAIQLNPSYAVAYNNRGNAYQAQQKYAEAIADYNQAIQLNPSYADAYNNRGYAYYQQQKYSEAIADYDRALALNPKHENAHKNREIALGKLRGR